MDQSEIFKKVRSIISEQLDKKEDEITMESRFVEDLGADSLDIYELLYLLEEAFDDKIPENEASEFETIGDVVAFIEKKRVRYNGFCYSEVGCGSEKKVR